ncbi:hypothetical protein F0562_035909 [Nyssa sinensis]|uniref:Patatin n=1 Tax=Nyssa sinensis TaxID=561372 RepID=A0A5J5AE76_9ASTE|nr:hypothetical protein F0562_035909 [Nyssa sinensis]
MLTTPNEENRPMFAAKDIKAFYLEHCPSIFPQDSCPFSHATKVIKALSGPKYDGKYLHNIVKEKLRNTRLHETLTDVVIPTFDIKRLQPTIFSSYELENNPSLDALLSDICIATSAAPTYLPAHYFETKDPSGRIREFNLVDGGVAANNPALVAMSEVSKKIHRGSTDFPTMNPIEYDRFLVVSLGTGSAKIEEKYDAEEAAKWGVWGWFAGGGSTPLVDIFTQASGDMDDTLSGIVSSVDIATKENLENLLKVGEELLKKPVSRVNLQTGCYEPSNQGTNEEALIRLAKTLSKEKQLRDARSPRGRAAKLN